MNYSRLVSICTRLAFLALLSGLAACGGNSEKEQACDQAAKGYFPILNGLACVFGATENGTAKPSDSGTTGSAIESQSFGYQVGEYEPNTSLNNANPIALNSASVAVAGSLAFANDAVDNFIFTPTQSGNYNVYLCAETCDQALEAGNLGLMILDQSQTTIAATPLGAAGDKTLAVKLDAGVAYYTEVSTLGANANYRLAITRQ